MMSYLQRNDLDASPRPGGAWMLGLVVGCAAFLSLAHARADEVATRVVVEAPSFVVNLQGGKAQAEGAASDALTAALHSHFPVTTWRAASTSTTTALTLALVERKAAPLSEVSIVWRATVDGTSLDMPGLDPILLYSTFDANRANHDPDALAQLLASEIKRWFANEANRKDFQSAFLRNVPIARRATADAQRRRVVLPFSAAALRMDTSSELRLKVSSAGMPQQHGLIDVSGLLDDTGGALGTVTRINFTDGFAADGWTTRVPALLAPSNRVIVYVERYIYSAAPTVNGNFQQP